jgi:uncharacterized protein DUF3147
LNAVSCMSSELAVRFLLGGAIVSIFAVVAEMWEPKTFAGIFGAAPSVALASLAMAFHKHGGDYVAIEGRTIVVGSLALFTYSCACVAVAKREHVPVWLGAAAAWVLWFMTALGLWQLGTVSGVL